MFIYTCPRLYDQKLKGGVFMYFTFPLSKKDKSNSGNCKNQRICVLLHLVPVKI